MSRTFKLIRDEDVSHVSGTGFVAEGVVFSTGRVALHWPGRMPTTTSLDSLDWVLEIHGHGGKTRLVWDDESCGDPGFMEDDIEFLHDILEKPEDPFIKSHQRARSLLSKVRLAMRRQIPGDSPVRT